jgi:thiamine biosynthesis lipoprotein
MSVAVKSWEALGTSVHVLTTDPDQLAAAETAVRGILQDVDVACSRFRHDSDLSRLNATGNRVVEVSPLLASAIGTALRAARITNGAVDPTVGPALARAGYDDDFSRIAADGGPITLRGGHVPGWQAIRFDHPSRSVLLPAGVELDLGSTGKALAADLSASTALTTIAAGGVLVSLGGDLATAGTPPGGGWRVLIAEDSRVAPDGEGQVICLHDGSVATSSTTVRRWTRGGAVLHHIIDPVTGLPTTGPWRTATVVAGTCVDANIAATAAIVLGEAAVEWLQALRLPARLVEKDGTIHHLGRWPEPEGITR